MIDIELLGFVYHWGLDVNSITVIGEYVSRPYFASNRRMKALRHESREGMGGGGAGGRTPI